MFSLEKIPKRKCGAEVIVGGILGGAGLLGSALASSSATRSQEEQNALNRSYNSAESQKAREWSTNERLAAQAYNTSEREAAQRYQTASVPQNIASSISALRASGVNANVIGSSAINSGATGSSGQTAPIGSGGQASFGTGINPQVMQIPQLISSGAEMVNALSKNKETRANLPLIDANVRLALEKMYGQQKANELQDLYIKFERSNLPTKLKKSMEEYVSLVLQNGNAVKQGKVFDKQSDLLDAQRNVQDQVAKLRGAEAIQAQFYADHVADIYKADMSLKGAQTKSANSSAFLSTQQAKEIEKMLPYKEQAAIVSGALADIDYDIAKLTKIDNIENAHNEAKRLRNMVEHGEILGRYLAPDGSKVNRTVYDDFEDGIMTIWRHYKRGVERGIEKSKK